MSYTIDIYRKHLHPTKNVFHFFAYLSMFPQLVAGPIVRASELLPQLEKSHPTTEKERWEGLGLIVHGYFKKVVIADNLAPVVSAAFGATTPSESTLYWWVAITAFAFQIYCDFSGYSDIARGLARWMGYDFLVNFNHPYTASSIREFWSKWHISLSTWFRDYVYIPLGGARKGKTRSHIHMWITMVVSGLWHGAAWNFVIWGALHAFFLTVERITNWPDRLKKLYCGRIIATLIMLVEVWVSWVFFRAESFAQACYILKCMFSFKGGVSRPITFNAAVILCVVIIEEVYVYFRLDRTRFLSPAKWRVIHPLLWAILIWACIYFRGPGSEFIYFQF
jgi:alginate O-acetyltransferase complex protein AlgI